MASLDELKTLITNGNADISATVTKIQQSTDLLKTRIEEVNQNISGELRKIEEKFELKIKSVEETQVEFSKSLAFTSQSNQEEFTELKNRVLALENRYTANCTLLNKANDKIVEQQNTITSLEKSSYSSQQHQRGWNTVKPG